MDQRPLFKKQITALGILWALGLLAPGCSKDIVDKTLSSEASVFEVGRIAAYSTLPTTKKNWSDFQTGNYIDFVADLKNKGINAPLLNDTFSIKTPNGHFVVRSDENGRIHWGEHHSLHFVGQEHYRPHTIVIEGIGRHKGRYSIPLAVNPWKNNSQAVKDLRFDQLAPKYLVPQKAAGATTKAPIRVKNMNITYREGFLKNPKTYSTTYDISLSPTFKRLDLEKGLIETPFKEGFFALELILLEKSPKNNEYFQIAKAKKNVSIQNLLLNTTVTFDIQSHNWPKATSLLNVLVNIKPIESPPPLTSFQGVITMSNMLENNHKTPTPITPQLNDYIISRMNFTQEQHRDDFVFEIDEVSAQYGALTGNNYNKNTNKTLQSKIKMRLSGALQKEILRKTRFQVTLTDENHENRSVKKNVDIDSQGNLEFPALIHYNVYNCEHWFPLKIEIEAISGQFQGLKKERKVAVNPWNQTNFFYDIKRQGSPPQSPCILPKVHIPKVKYTNEEIDQENFYLDRYLNLSLRKFYRIIFRPQLKMYSSHLQETSLSPIMHGDFTLRWDLYTPKKHQVDYHNVNLDHFTYVTSAEKDISVKEGIVDEIMALPFYIEETIALSYKNLVVLTLIPKNEPYLQQATRHFTFYAKDSHRERETWELTNYQLKPKDLDILNHIRLTGFKIPPGFDNEELPNSVELYKQYLQNTQGEKRKTMFISPSQLNDHLLTDTHNYLFYKREYPQITQLDYNRFFHSPSSLPSSILKKVCPLFYAATDLSDCFESPHEHIERMPVTHILEIVTKKNVINTNGNTLKIPHATFINDRKSTIQLGDRFSVSVGQRSSNGTGIKNALSHYESYSWGFNIPISLYFTLGESVSRETEHYRRGLSSSMSTAFSFSYADLKQLALALNSIKLRFNARVISCFSLFPKGHPSITVQAHVCEKERYAKMEEEWFFVANLAGKDRQIISDPARIGDRDGPVLIRGRFNFNRFWDNMERGRIFSTKNVLSYVEQEQDHALKEYLSLLNRRKVSLFAEEAIQEYNFFPGLSVLTGSPSTKGHK